MDDAGWTFGGVIHYQIARVISLPFEFIIVYSITGSIGGIVTACMVWYEDVLSNWKSIFWTTFIWTTAYWLGLIMAAIVEENFRNIASITVSATSGAIMGALGGYFTTWVIGREKRKADTNPA